MSDQFLSWSDILSGHIQIIIILSDFFAYAVQLFEEDTSEVQKSRTTFEPFRTSLQPVQGAERKVKSGFDSFKPLQTLILTTSNALQ